MLYDKVVYRQKLLIALCVLFIIPFVIVAGFSLRNTYVQKSEMMRNDMRSSINLGLNRYKKLEDDIYAKIFFFSGYNKIHEIINASKPISIDNLVAIRGEINNIVNAVYTGRDTDAISIYTTNPNSYSMSIIKKIDDSYDEFLKELPYDNTVYVRNEKKDSKEILSYYKKLFSSDKYFTVINYRIPLKSISDCFKNISEKEYDLVLINEKGECFDIVGNTGFSKKEELFESGRVYEGTDTKFLNGKIYAVINNFDINKEVINELRTMLLLFGCVFIVLIAGMYLAVNYFSDGISVLIEAIRNNDFSKAENRFFYNKDLKLVKDYIFELQEKLNMESREKYYATITNLSQRMSPHFLYNSLSAIRKTANNERTSRSIDLLIKYYRYIFNNKNEFVMVEKEIQILSTYAEMLAYSYGCNFDYSAKCDESAAKLDIPNNILQPLIENAFIHGISMLDDDNGKISVSVATENNNIVIYIENTSKKSELDVLRINENLDNEDKALGIIYKRLEYLYKDDFKMYATAMSDIVRFVFEIPL